mmetsp:Transcript_21179/g.34940  ORF Transcript_21179/g.34940 Transcript_21179/m.34940 type:complete len:784 (-) Transcript_21179:394-2745(-)
MTISQRLTLHHAPLPLQRVTRVAIIALLMNVNFFYFGRNNISVQNERLKSKGIQQQQQCPIPENHTAMEISWLNFVKKSGLLPQSTSIVPPEGVFLNGWDPTLDCPSAFETLQWKSGMWWLGKSESSTDDSRGEISCPPGAPMWTFLEGSISPAVSATSSSRIICPESGTYPLPPGQGVLCKNSVRLRPSRNDAAINRAKGLLHRRQLQLNDQKVTKEGRGTTGTGIGGTVSNNDASIATTFSLSPQASSESTHQKTNISTRPPHILVYMQDAVSRPALYRNLKATHQTIKNITEHGEDLGTHVYEFKRHHSMGGSSINNLTPMLTGLAYDKMVSHSRTYEAWAFEEFRRLGYVSINLHNTCQYFNATYGDAFNRHGPEHYFPYEMEDIGWFGSAFCQPQNRQRIPHEEVQANCARTLQDNAKHCMPSKENNMQRLSCLGGRSRSSLLIEYYLKVREDLEDNHEDGGGIPTFTFLHDFDLHLEKVTDLHRYDEDKATTLNMLRESGVLRNTVFIYISDHGNQQKIITTEQGSIEYKLPFWYLMVPDLVLDQRSDRREDIQAALQHNQQVLTSQADVHETMLDLAGGRGMGDAEWWQLHGHDPDLLGKSVLRSLPYNRTCEDVGIPPMACVCSNITFNAIPPDSKLFHKTKRDILPSVIKHMNGELEKFHLISSGVCRELKAKDLVSASSRPNSEILTTYNLRFIVESPRSEPMEFVATTNKGVQYMSGVYVGTVNQASRFAHWIEQCRQKVTDVGGNHHFCDCVEPPAVYGWELNQTALEEST